MIGPAGGCAGGHGGTGGTGGGGGGGRGGHSAAIVYTGNAPTIDAMSMLTHGGNGKGGTGQGNGTMPGNDGTAGTACSVLNFGVAMETCTVQ